MLNQNELNDKKKMIKLIENINNSNLNSNLLTSVYLMNLDLTSENKFENL